MARINGPDDAARCFSRYGKPHEDPRYPGGHNLRVLNFTNGIMNEHTAVFESVNKNNASFNVETVKRDMATLDAAALEQNGSKIIFVQTW